jgi:hypothetical protein
VRKSWKERLEEGGAKYVAFLIPGERNDARVECTWYCHIDAVMNNAIAERLCRLIESKIDFPKVVSVMSECFVSKVPIGLSKPSMNTVILIVK